MIVLQRITLHLARTKQHPEGTSKIGYDIVAPLDRAGRLDADAWRAHRAECRVKRFRASKPEAYGVLLHRPGGVDGATWAIDYNLDRADDDEVGYRLGSHSFKLGDYVSIRDEDGEMQTFRVADVRPAQIAA
jgi:hypothetical protein